MFQLISCNNKIEKVIIILYVTFWCTGKPLAPPGGSLLLRKHTEDETALAVWLKGGRNDDVLPRGKLESSADLPEIDEGAAHGHRPLSQKHVRAQVNVGTALILPTDMGRGVAKQSTKLSNISKC